MKVLIQRVNKASVEVEGKIVGEIGLGLLLLTGLGQGDDESTLRPMAEKITNLRVFADESGRFHNSLLDVGDVQAMSTLQAAVAAQEIYLHDKGDDINALGWDYAHCLNTAECETALSDFGFSNAPDHVALFMAAGSYCDTSACWSMTGPKWTAVSILGTGQVFAQRLSQVDYSLTKLTVSTTTQYPQLR